MPDETGVNPPTRPRVAVITPYYREAPEVLRLCHDSVLGQSYPCTHFLVADGHPQEQVSGWAAQHLILPQAHQDVGNTPRCLGALSAVSQDFDAVTFLDADNWFYPNHVEAMVRLQAQTGADLCTATRSMHRPDGSLMYVDRHECDGQRHVDTNCFYLTRSAFAVLPVWALMPRQLALVGDTVFFQAVLARPLRRAHHAQPTVAYRTTFRVHYELHGEAAPAGARSNEETTGRAYRWWASLTEEVRRQWSATLLGPGRLLMLPPGRAPAPGPVLPAQSSAAEEERLAVQLLAQGRFAKAELVLRHVLLLQPDAPETAFHLARALQGQERLAEAEHFFRQALRHRPDWAEAHFHLGLVLDAQRRLSAADSAFREGQGSAEP